jgi:murein tripeptide amidase MpaA
MRIKTILISLFVIVISTGFAENRCVVRISDPGWDEVLRYDLRGWDVASRSPGEYLDLVVSESQIPELRILHPELIVTQTTHQMLANLTPSKDIPGYHTYAETLAEIMQAQAQYPSLVQVSTIGNSWGALYASENIPAYQNFDHQLWAVKVSANVDLTEDEPAFFFVGAHHAREPISTEVTLAILANLTENYGTDPFVTDVLNSTEIWIVPLLNPDGHKLVLDQTDVWWRKNIRDNDQNQQLLPIASSDDGVDLNRNYGYRWGYMSASDFIYSDTYHGPAPLSEPESSAFAALITSRPFMAGISYHTYGQYVLYPYGYVYDIEAPDKAELQALAQSIAAVIPKVGSSSTYDAMPSYQLYPVSGSLDDWVYSTTGTFSYTIEMATQFIPQASSFPNIIPPNVAGAMVMLDRKNKKLLQGHVTDAITGLPLPARIHVSGIDDNPVYRAPVFADAAFGSFYRMLPAGSHNVRFMYPGYETVETPVQINPSSVTVLDIALLPSQPYDLVIHVRDELQQPIDGACVVFSHDEQTQHLTDDMGSVVIPDFYPGQYIVSVSKPGYGTLRITRNIASPSVIFRIGQSPAFQDGFENGLSNWTASPNWAATANEAFSGNMSLTDSPAGNYTDNNNTWIKLAQPLDLQDVQSASLQFMVKHNLALDGDYLCLQYSLTGQNWKVLWSIAESADWTLYDIDLNSFIGHNLYLRFFLNTMMYDTADGVYIDDVKVFTSSDVTSAPQDVIPQPVIRLAASPNPFNASCRIRISSPADVPAHHELGVYNLRGQLVRQFQNISLTRGDTVLNWDGRDANGSPAANGVYFIRLSANSRPLATARVLLMK